MKGSTQGSGTFSSPAALLFFSTIAACVLLLSLTLLSREDAAALIQRDTELRPLRLTKGGARTISRASADETSDKPPRGLGAAAAESARELVTATRPKLSGVAAAAARIRTGGVLGEEDDGNAGKPLWPSPSAEELRQARETYARRCREPDAWVNALWDTDRNRSYTSQMEVREALNMLGQEHISAISVKSRAELKPCKRTVVSISTIPGRINRLGGLIRSIKAQDYQPDAILIGVAPFAPRMRERYVVPEYLRKDPAVRIVDLPVDFGPLSKVAAAIYHEKDPDTCIITVDDDNEPREYLFRIIATWASMFPTAVIGESGWNRTCIIDRLPYICGEGYDAFLFVRQWIDFMCSAEALPVYNIHPCVSEVRSLPRATDVVMGVSNPLYRRWMFKDDFLDIAKEMVRRKLQKLLADDAEARAQNDASKRVPDDILQLAREALEHPDMQRDAVGDLWDRISPPSGLFVVDDVYIAAHMAKEGIPRLIVPAVPDTAKPPIPLVPKRQRSLGEVIPDPGGSYDEHISDVHALHGESGFNGANHAAVRFFHHVGYW